jgi:hypothetical protein
MIRDWPRSDSSFLSCAQREERLSTDKKHTLLFSALSVEDLLPLACRKTGSRLSRTEGKPAVDLALYLPDDAAQALFSYGADGVLNVRTLSRVVAIPSPIPMHSAASARSMTWKNCAPPPD